MQLAQNFQNYDVLRSQHRAHKATFNDDSVQLHLLANWYVIWLALKLAPKLTRPKMYQNLELLKKKRGNI